MLPQVVTLAEAEAAGLHQTGRVLACFHCRANVVQVNAAGAGVVFSGICRPCSRLRALAAQAIQEAARQERLRVAAEGHQAAARRAQADREARDAHALECPVCFKIMTEGGTVPEFTRLAFCRVYGKGSEVRS